MWCGEIATRTTFLLTAPLFFTVKLGSYVHGLVRTLGYNVLSVDHEHRQWENMYIFFG